MSGERVFITGIGIEMPGLSGTDDLLQNRPLQNAEFDPTVKLGGRGLRYKDRATQLALCAVHDAVEDAELPKMVDASRTGVVVSSNLGNIDTICRMAKTVRDHTVVALSPMDVPNASSNVIATTIAIRFDCKAANLMVCNGATSGIDAIYLATTLIRAGRAHRIIVVGVEPRNSVVTALLETSRDEKAPLHLGEGAACIVLESASIARKRGVRIYGEVGRYSFTPATHIADGRLHLSPFQNAPIRLWLVPPLASAATTALVQGAATLWAVPGPHLWDLMPTFGDLYGALGVFQVIAALSWCQAQLGMESGATLVTSGGTWRDGVASTVVLPVADDPWHLKD